MIKIFMVTVFAIMIGGCGSAERMGATLTGYSLVCVKGVSYVQFTSGASVQYDQTGKVVTCK